MEKSKEPKKPTISKQEKIKVLEAQLADLKKKAREEANRIASQEKAVARKLETRKKIILGALILDQLKDENVKANYIKKLDRYLKRNSERRLFGLPDIKEDSFKEEGEVTGDESPLDDR